MRPTPLAAVLTVVLAANVAACSDGGALSQTSFAPDCPDTDLTCTALGIDAPIAVGARLALRLDTDTPGVATPPLSLESADSAILGVDGREVVGVAPGVAALLVTTDAGVMDFIHIFVAEPQELVVRRHAEDGRQQGELGDAVQMLVGESLLLSAQLFDDAQPLLGTEVRQWNVMGDNLTQVDDGLRGMRRFVARDVGTAVIDVTDAGMGRSLMVEVLP